MTEPRDSDICGDPYCSYCGPYCSDCGCHRATRLLLDQAVDLLADVLNGDWREDLIEKVIDKYNETVAQDDPELRR